MKIHYADQRIRELLAAAKGQGKVTEQAIRTLLERDPKFLLSLVSPYLNGIIAQAIERNRKRSGITDATSPPSAVAVKKTESKREMSPASLDRMMKSWAKDFDTAGKGQRDKPVSQTHLDVMKALVKKSYGKRRD